MSVINIETTQNVTIDYQLAGLGSRILSYLIDFAILFAYCLLIIFLANSLKGSMDQDLFAFFQIGLIAIPFVFYDLVCEVFFNGQSVGKRSMGIKVVKIDGSKPSIGAYLIRWASRILEGIFPLYGIVPVITIAVSEKGQRLGDMMAGTTVIRTNKRKHVIRNPLDMVTEQEDYHAKYPEAINLTDSDIRIIKEAIRTYKFNSKREPIDAVTEKVEEILSVKCNEPPIQFLSNVISDYNHLITRDI